MYSPRFVLLRITTPLADLKDKVIPRCVIGDCLIETVLGFDSGGAGLGDESLYLFVAFVGALSILGHLFFAPARQPTTIAFKITSKGFARGDALAGANLRAFQLEHPWDQVLLPSSRRRAAVADEENAQFNWFIRATRICVGCQCARNDCDGKKSNCNPCRRENWSSIYFPDLSVLWKVVHSSAYRYPSSLPT